MKVILLKDVKNVGKKFQETEVANGHALNFLIPQGLARTATDSTLQALAEERKQHAEAMKKREEELAGQLKELGEATVTITAKANEQGHLFASVGREEVQTALKEQHHIELDTEHIDLEHALKEVGDHEVPVQIAEAQTTLTVTIEAEE